ncbi:MAG: flavodoxin domain-containing protein [Salaquimonas sp.]
MRFLILYATVEGQTRKIAETLVSWLEEKGHNPTVTDVRQIGYCDPAEFDGVLACAPIHINQYPEAFVNFIRDWKGSLASTKTVLITVSLAIASENADEVAEATAYPRSLEEETGWKADYEYNAAGALKYIEYDFFKRWMMRRIAYKEGGPVDTSKDHELTDWDDLKKFTESFVDICAE